MEDHSTQVSQNPEHVVDELNDSPLLASTLGDALPKCTLFHVKLEKEGLLRGLVGPRDMGILWERHILNSAAVVPFIRQVAEKSKQNRVCLLYTSPSPRDKRQSRMPSSA